MTQLSLFDLDRQRPTLAVIDPDGAVVPGPADVTLRLPHPRLAWDLARIEVHEHEDGRWMWAIGHASGGFKVGPKWGRFAKTQREATRLAACELMDWCDRNDGRTDGMCITRAQLAQIRDWAEALT